MKRVHLKEEIQCKLCDFRTTHQQYLSGHIRRVHEGHLEGKPYINCTECSYKSKSKGNLRVSNSYFDSFIFQMSSSRGGVERNSMLLVALHNALKVDQNCKPKKAMKM